MDKAPQQTNPETEYNLLFRRVEERIKALRVLSLREFLAVPGNLEKIKYKKIAVLGEPNLGKSTLSYGIRDKVNSISRNLPVYVLSRTNADGQGSWTSGTARASLVRATKLKGLAKR